MAEGDAPRPSRKHIATALNFLIWLQQQAERNGTETLDETELADLWYAAETAKGVIEPGEIGFRRAEHLQAADPRRADPSSRITFEEAARLAGPVLARLQAELDDWPSHESTYGVRRRPSVTVRVAAPRLTGRRPDEREPRRDQ